MELRQLLSGSSQKRTRNPFRLALAPTLTLKNTLVVGLLTLAGAVYGANPSYQSFQPPEFQQSGSHIVIGTVDGGKLGDGTVTAGKLDAPGQQSLAHADNALTNNQTTKVTLGAGLAVAGTNSADFFTGNGSLLSGLTGGGDVTSAILAAATNAVALVAHQEKLDSTNAARLASMGFALLTDATNAATKARQDGTNITSLTSMGLALLTDATNAATGIAVNPLKLATNAVVVAGTNATVVTNYSAGVIKYTVSSTATGSGGTANVVMRPSTHITVTTNVAGSDFTHSVDSDVALLDGNQLWTGLPEFVNDVQFDGQVVVTNTIHVGGKMNVGSTGGIQATNQMEIVTAGGMVNVSTNGSITIPGSVYLTGSGDPLIIDTGGANGLSTTNAFGGAAFTAHTTNGDAVINSVGNFKTAGTGLPTEVNFGTRGNKTNGLYFAADDEVDFASYGTNTFKVKAGTAILAASLKVTGFTNTAVGSGVGHFDANGKQSSSTVVAADMSGNVLTNSGNTTDSLVAYSNAVAGIKSLSAGANVTLTDQGTNIVVTSGTGGSATNAISTILTNGTSVSSAVITNLNFIPSGNMTITGSVSSGQANIGFQSTASGGGASYIGTFYQVPTGLNNVQGTTNFWGASAAASTAATAPAFGMRFIAPDSITLTNITLSIWSSGVGAVGTGTNCWLSIWTNAVDAALNTTFKDSSYGVLFVANGTINHAIGTGSLHLNPGVQFIFGETNSSQVTSALIYSSFTMLLGP